MSASGVPTRIGSQPLGEKQLALLEYLKSCREIPTRKQMCDKFGWKNVSQAAQALDRLEDHGKIRRENRKITILGDN